MNDTTENAAATLQDFVRQGWADHEQDSPAVMTRLPEGIDLVREPGHLPALAGLITHVSGEHLGRWADGLALLERLTRSEAFDAADDTGRAVLRSQAVLHLCAGDATACEALLARAHDADAPAPAASTRARVLAVAASALAGQGQVGAASAAFQEALDLIDYGPGADDPAVRALAITGNNLACALEERADRSPEEDALLELAAQAARTWWEVAGTWSNVQIAEYRLAMTYLALSRPETARTHAARCLELCEAHGAGPGDMLFAHEVNARAAHAGGDAEAAAAHQARARAALADVDDGLRSYAEQTLAKLDAALV